MRRILLDSGAFPHCSTNLSRNLREKKCQ